MYVYKNLGNIRSSSISNNNIYYSKCFYLFGELDIASEMVKKLGVSDSYIWFQFTTKFLIEKSVVSP